jgi:hypothetical protein
VAALLPVVLDSTSSLEGNGSTAGLKLSGDVLAPGNNYFYGTSATGVKGWYVLPSGLYLGAAATYAALPTTTGSGNFAFLSADDIGAGTAIAPQYVRGAYRWNGTAYVLDQSMPLPVFRVQRLSATNAALRPGTYDIDSSGGAFDLTLSDEVGVWEFHNSNRSLGTNAVTMLSTGGRTFTNAAGVQTALDFQFNVSGKAVTVVHTEVGTAYRVSIDDAVTAPVTFTPNGAWNAATNTPNLNTATNRVSGSTFFVYYVSTTGTVDLGSGATLFEAGGRIEWFSATVYNYIGPQSAVPAATETVQGRVELATDAEALAGTDTARALTPANAAATYVRRNIVTTKGDVLAATGAGALARVAVGTDGQALVADAASAAGVRFATVVPVDASATVKGIVELATDAEAETGTDTVRALTPANAASVYVKKSLIDAKGDLIVGSAADTIVRLPVGANGGFLTADSAEAGGLKWAATQATYTGLQRVGSSTTVLAVTATNQNYVLPVVPLEGDLLEVDYGFNNNTTERSQFWIKVTAGTTQQFVAWPDVNLVSRFVFPATLTNTIQIRATTGNSSPRVLGIRMWRDAANGYVVPTATVVRQPVTVTANAGAVNVNAGASAQGYAGTAMRATVTVPVGQFLSAVAASNGGIASISDGRSGAVELSIPTGTTGAVDLTCTFATYGGPRVLAQANAGVAVTLGTLRFQMPTSGNRSLQWAAVAGTVNVRAQSVHQDGAAGTGLVTNAALTTTFAYVSSGFNFSTAGSSQEVIVEDQTNGRWYRMKMEVGSAFNNNTFAGHEI